MLLILLMSFPYIEPSGFQAVELRDANDNKFGNLHLCTVQGVTLPDSPPGPDGGTDFPGAPSSVNSFPEVFTDLAHEIGQQLFLLNKELLNLHKASIGNQTVDPTHFLVQAEQLAVDLGLIAPGQSGKDRKYWPLVGFNDGNKSIPLNSGPPPVVSTLEVANSNFPVKPNDPPPNGPDHKNALYFSTQVPIDNNRKAVGSIVFYQDCVWNGNPPPNDKSWCSWGFVTNFELTLYELVPTATAVASSSSSSSYYAASSSLPGLH